MVHNGSSDTLGKEEERLGGRMRDGVGLMLRDLRSETDQCKGLKELKADGRLN